MAECVSVIERYFILRVYNKFKIGERNGEIFNFALCSLYHPVALLKPTEVHHAEHYIFDKEQLLKAFCRRYPSSYTNYDYNNHDLY